MHTIYDCVKSFCPLLDTRYYLVLGRKGVAVKLDIRFDKKDCFHLMGLQYLTDMPNLSRDRGKIFDEIIEQKITHKQVEASDYYKKIAERVDLLPYLADYYFCRSFFPEGKRDYTKNQASWTLLYKKKTRLSTGEETILYDRMRKSE